MPRSTDAQKAGRLNAAHGLLARGTSMAEAAVSCRATSGSRDVRHIGISRKPRRLVIRHQSAAEGRINAVLVHSPDRLSRKYAYQILLIEELARAGVETVFLKAPRTETAEDQLLLQFQGMIAEYER